MLSWYGGNQVANVQKSSFFLLHKKTVRQSFLSNTPYTSFCRPNGMQLSGVFSFTRHVFMSACYQPALLLALRETRAAIFGGTCINAIILKLTLRSKQSLIWVNYLTFLCLGVFTY